MLVQVNYLQVYVLIKPDVIIKGRLDIIYKSIKR